MKYKGAYRDAIHGLRVVPAARMVPLIPPPTKPRPVPETRDEALIRLGELEQELLRNKRGYRRDSIIAEKMQISTLLSTTLKRRPTPRKATRADFKPTDETIPYVGPRCDFCGGEAPGGVCVNLEGWPHP